MRPDLIAQKIRKNLLEQKTKLHEYLKVLDHEEKDLLEEDPDKLIAHIKLEADIVKELELFKKIITPLEEMYFRSPYKKEDSILDIKKDIDGLAQKVMAKSAGNKGSLDTILQKVKADLKGINKKKMSKNAYVEAETGLVDISG